jgi:hypothetical protein
LNITGSHFLRIILSPPFLPKILSSLSCLHLEDKSIQNGESKLKGKKDNADKIHKEEENEVGRRKR